MCLAMPGEILSIDSEDELMRQGRVSFAGIIKQVNFAYVPEAVVGAYVLVHAGFAIAVVAADEARETLALIDTESDEP